MPRNLTVFLVLITWTEMSKTAVIYIVNWIHSKQNKLGIACYISMMMLD